MIGHGKNGWAPIERTGKEGRKSSCELKENSPKWERIGCGNEVLGTWPQQSFGKGHRG